MDQCIFVPDSALTLIYFVNHLKISLVNGPLNLQQFMQHAAAM